MKAFGMKLLMPSSPCYKMRQLLEEHYPEGPSTQDFRTLVPNTIESMVFWNQRPQLLGTWTLWVSHGQDCAREPHMGYLGSTRVPFRSPDQRLP